MSSDKTISTDAFDQLKSTLNQIATDMCSIKGLLDDLVEDGKFDHRGASIELIASRSGSLADRLADTLGEPPVRGGLEDWFD